MFHNVYQRFNDFRLLNKSPWNSDENLIRNEELELNWELGVRSYIYNICTCVRAQEGGLYITNLQRWSLLMTKAKH